MIRNAPGFPLLALNGDQWLALLVAVVIFGAAAFLVYRLARPETDVDRGETTE